MKSRKRNFSSFDYASAFKELGIENLQTWDFAFAPVASSDLFPRILQRLNRTFALVGSERAKELIIDAVFGEAGEQHERLKIWKAAAIESDTLTGLADYVVAPSRGYLDTPLLCVAEAKRDDFEQGLAQCLVEMKACRWKNEQTGLDIELHGIVTNGTGWQFYKMTKDGQVWESPLYAISQIEDVLGGLHYIFGQCEEQINNATKK